MTQYCLSPLLSTLLTCWIVLCHRYNAGEFVPDFQMRYSVPTTSYSLADFGLGKFSGGNGGTIGSVGTGEMGTEPYMAPVSEPGSCWSIYATSRLIRFRNPSVYMVATDPSRTSFRLAASCTNFASFAGPTERGPRHRRPACNLPTHQP